MGAISENYYPIRRPINLNELDGYREDVYQHLLEMGEKGGWLAADYLERQIRYGFLGGDWEMDFIVSPCRTFICLNDGTIPEFKRNGTYHIGIRPKIDDFCVTVFSAEECLKFLYRVTSGEEQGGHFYFAPIGEEIRDWNSPYWDKVHDFVNDLWARYPDMALHFIS